MLGKSTVYKTAKRPSIYKPYEANLVNLSNLHRAFDYVGPIEVSVSSEDESANEKKNKTKLTDALPVFYMGENERIKGNQPKQVEIVGQQFQRIDNKKINYFQAIQDAPDKENKYPTLDQWLETYKKLNNEQLFSRVKTSIHDISIVPFLQVQRGRKHFNTLLIHADKDGTVYVYIIEPRSSNLTRSSGFYPIDESKKKIIDAIQGQTINGVKVKNIKFSNPKMGHQPFYDDTECGAHHINYVEIIAQLRDRDIENQKSFKKFLSRARLDRRNSDNQKIDFVLKTTGLDKEEKVEAKSDELIKKEDIDTKKSKEEDLFEDFIEETKEDTKKTTADYKDVSIMQEQKNKDLNNAFIHSQSELIDGAIEEIKKYQTRYSAASFNLFSGHTRQKTSEQIINILDNIKTPKITKNTIQIQQASIILYGCFISIEGSSKFRDHVGHALAKLLNCEDEYHAIMKNKVFDKQHTVITMFKHKLILLERSHPVGFEYKEIFRNMEKICKADESLAYKFSTKRHDKIDKEREKTFEEIRANMGIGR